MRPGFVVHFRKCTTAANISGSVRFPTNRDAIEGTYRTCARVKEEATELYARWGLSLSDAINVFLVKPIEAGGLPFEMRSEAPSYERLRRIAYEAPVNEEGAVTLPADRDDGE